MSIFDRYDSVEPFFEDGTHQWEKVLIECAHRINEGQNGVIFSMDLDRMQPRERALLRIDSAASDQVAKLLKIGERGKLRREYEMQRVAWKAIEEARVRNPDGYARIPEPNVFHRFALTEPLKMWLEEQEVVSSAQEQQEMFIMDRVPGTDIDTCILRYFLKNSPRSVALTVASELDAYSHAQLEQLAARSMGYRFPPPPRRGWESEDWGRYSQFREEMERATAQLGFQLPVQLLDKIERSVDQLLQVGISWGDANLRNMMVEHSDSGEISSNGQVWLIDFGGAVPVGQDSPVNLPRKEILRTLERLRKTFTSRPRIATSAPSDTLEVVRHQFPAERFESWKEQITYMLHQPASGSFFQMIQAVGGAQIRWHERLIPVFAQIALSEPRLRPELLRVIEQAFRQPQTAKLVEPPYIRTPLTRLYNQLKASREAETADTTL